MTTERQHRHTEAAIWAEGTEYTADEILQLMERDGHENVARYCREVLGISNEDYHMSGYLVDVETGVVSEATLPSDDGQAWFAIRQQAEVFAKAFRPMSSEGMAAVLDDPVSDARRV